MTSSDGTPTGALYAFLNIYLKHLQELNPTYVCACFDLKAPTFRHIEYKEYKATRKPMPEDLAMQMPIIKEILDAMGIPRIEMEGYEADDLIGSLSLCSKQLGWETFILSGDKDDLQLVDDNTIVLMPLSRNGQTTTERFDVEAVVSKYKITPEQFIDLKAIMGDPSDNIPGVKGIGEKGATDLIVEYGSLDNIYESLNIIKTSLSDKLKASKEIAYLSKWLATIKRDIPLMDYLNKIHLVEINKNETYKILQKLGFRSIIQRLQISASTDNQPKNNVNLNNSDITAKENNEINNSNNTNSNVNTNTNINSNEVIANKVVIPEKRDISVQDLKNIILNGSLNKFHNPENKFHWANNKFNSPDDMIYSHDNKFNNLAKIENYIVKNEIDDLGAKDSHKKEMQISFDSIKINTVDTVDSIGNNTKETIKKSSNSISEKEHEISPENLVNNDFADFNIANEKGFLSVLQLSEIHFLVDCGEKEIFCINTSEIEELLEFIKAEKIRLVSIETKSFLRNQTIDVSEVLLFDVFVAGYLLSQSEGKASLERIAEICLGSSNYSSFEEEIATKPLQQSLFDDSSESEADKDKKKTEKAIYDLSLLNRIAIFQYEELDKRGLLFLAIQVEMPLIGILAGMERLGFAIDLNVLAMLNEDFTRRLEELERIIYEYAGSTFNINSPKQLGDILFKKLMLPSGKKNQNGFSTNAEVLEKLYDKHPIIKEISSYRQLSKLKSTFIEGLSKNVDSKDNRVHTTFNQTLTTTGRLSSSEPNLQNIPIKQEAGREIRKAFVASQGNVLVDADYSQIELRLLAEFSNDFEMLEAFRNNDDIHLNTAEEIFDLPRNMITSAMRSAAKTINFSIVYGIGDFSLAQDLGITLKQAHSYIEEYNKKYPGVKPYLDGLVKDAYTNGYVETLFRRRRTIGELKSANRNIRMFGERVAMNTPVQGTAADIIKIAMVIVTKRLKQSKCSAKLVLQVHDELILEVGKAEAEIASKILKESMESAVNLSIPLISEVKIGNCWFDTK